MEEVALCEGKVAGVWGFVGCLVVVQRLDDLPISHSVSLARAAFPSPCGAIRVVGHGGWAGVVWCGVVWCGTGQRLTFFGGTMAIASFAGMETCCGFNSPLSLFMDMRNYEVGGS